MQKVYTAASITDAHFVRELLGEGEIEATVQDERTFAICGEVPVVYPSVWVRDEDFANARKIVEAFERSRKSPPTGEPWTCPRCGERIDAQFTECWKCESVSDSKSQAVPLAPNTTKKPPPWVVLILLVLLAIAIAVALWRYERQKALRSHSNSSDLQLAHTNRHF